MSPSADFAVATCANVTSSPSYLLRNISFSYLPTASSFPAPSPHLHSPACLQHPHLLPAIRQAISDYRNSLNKKARLHTVSAPYVALLLPSSFLPRSAFSCLNALREHTNAKQYQHNKKKKDDNSDKDQHPLQYPQNPR